MTLQISVIGRRMKQAKKILEQNIVADEILSSPLMRAEENSASYFRSDGNSAKD